MCEIPFFSVVIPLYNKEKYIKKTLQGIINQTFRNFEIIIIDDGSTDSSCNIVESINDTRIHLTHQGNGGPSKARNTGIRLAKGKYIAFLDADDEWLPDKLQKQHELLNNNPEIFWACAAYKVIGGINEKNMTYSQPGVIKDAIDAISNGLSIWTSTVVVNKDVFKNERLLFNNNINRSEDIEVWYKLACLYPKIGYIKEQVAVYNIKLHGSLTNTAMEKEDFSFLSLHSRIDKELAIIDDYRRNNLIKTINRFNKSCIIGVWRSNKKFITYNNVFSPFIDQRLLHILNYTNFLPIIIKKIILKVIM